MSKTEIVTPETQRPVLSSVATAQKGSDSCGFKVVTLKVRRVHYLHGALPEDTIRRLGLDAYGAV